MSELATVPVTALKGVGAALAAWTRVSASATSAVSVSSARAWVARGRRAPNASVSAAAVNGSTMGRIASSLIVRPRAVDVV